MSVRIQFDNQPSFYTNLDFISGRVILSLVSDENVQAIVVKLEGESRTQLMRPSIHPHPHGRRDARTSVAAENHKILYQISTVFPSKESAGENIGNAAYSLKAGQHEYPFRFKIPLNNGCADPQAQGMGPGSGFGGFGLAGLQQMQYRHVKKTLPPSLTGFPGEAEIRYYVKVTVQRPSIFKENRRAAMGFRFLPIESPRPPITTNEAYARRPFAFQPGLSQSKKNMFKKSPMKLSNTPPTGEIDARLPSPPILTCNEPIPLRLIARKLTASPENIFLTSLSIHLFGYTEVRAQDVAREETSNWVLMSKTGLDIPIGSSSDAVRTETVLDKSLWDRIPLPPTVTPSFQTCNLSRRYEMEVRVGLGYGLIGDIQPQSITLPLRFQLEIFSGIKPPAALLNAINNQAAPALPVRPSNIPPPTPIAPLASDPLYPPQLGTPAAALSEEAPPSYEDAMADDVTLTQADGPRREYSGVTDVDAPNMDDKNNSTPAPRYSTIFSPGSSGGRGGGAAGAAGAGGSHSTVV